MNNNVKTMPLCMVYKDKIEQLPDDKISKEIVGAKAYGLSKIPFAWTLPFFVISSEMYELYTECYDFDILKEVWGDRIKEAMKIKGFDLSEDVFLRSNMCSEGLIERGQFESYSCNSNRLFLIIKTYFENIGKTHSKNIHVPLLVQQYSQVLGCGHISNERRVSKEDRDWQGEIERENDKLITSNDSFALSLRNWRRKIIVDKARMAHPLKCSSLENIAKALKFPCAWATNQQLRLHFEWIFDGKNVYIVQADEEHNYGISPIVKSDSSYHIKNNIFSPQILQTLSSKAKELFSQYSKICNPLIYDKLGLKTIPIYILGDEVEIKNLVNGKISKELSDDLAILTINPLVIRVDINTEDQLIKQMLPRTETIRNKNDAIDWLIKVSKELYDELKDELSYIFIFHNFIPAFSSAFAYAEPKSRIVRLESLWGIPDGLYYYTHDKYVVDTKHNDFSKVVDSEISITRKINPKNNFIFPTADGKWKSDQVSSDYIWKPAIPKKAWLKEIVKNTRMISEYIKTGVSVMWFVGLDNKVYGSNVFPWHHEQYTCSDVPKQINRKKHSSETKFTISRSNDLEKLRQIVQDGNRENVKYLSLKPIEENIIRNKDLITEVGGIAKNLNAVIILEGGLLRMLITN
jgi:hypothetical protein